MKYLLNKQETQRLKFRLLEKDDFNDWLPLFSADKVAEFLGLDPSKSPNELCQIWFDKVFARYENDLGGMNVLIEKSSNKLVGQSGLLIQTIEEEERLEISYSILPEYWNKGYASEAAQKCKDFAFQNEYRDSLISIVNIDNYGSEKVARNNGMSLEKRIDDYHGSQVNIFSIDVKNWK